MGDAEAPSGDDDEAPPRTNAEAPSGADDGATWVGKVGGAPRERFSVIMWSFMSTSFNNQYPAYTKYNVGYNRPGRRKRRVSLTKIIKRPKKGKTHAMYLHWAQR